MPLSAWGLRQVVMLCATHASFKVRLIFQLKAPMCSESTAFMANVIQVLNARKQQLGKVIHPRNGRLAMNNPTKRLTVQCVTVGSSVSRTCPRLPNPRTKTEIL